MSVTSLATRQGQLDREQRSGIVPRPATDRATVLYLRNSFGRDVEAELNRPRPQMTRKPFSFPTLHHSPLVLPVVDNKDQRQNLVRGATHYVDCEMAPHIREEREIDRHLGLDYYDKQGHVDNNGDQVTVHMPRKTHLRPDQTTLLAIANFYTSQKEHFPGGSYRNLLSFRAGHPLPNWHTELIEPYTTATNDRFAWISQRVALGMGYLLPDQENSYDLRTDSNTLLEFYTLLAEIEFNSIDEQPKAEIRRFDIDERERKVTSTTWFKHLCPEAAVFVLDNAETIGADNFPYNKVQPFLMDGLRKFFANGLEVKNLDKLFKFLVAKSNSLPTAVEHCERFLKGLYQHDKKGDRANWHFEPRTDITAIIEEIGSIETALQILDKSGPTFPYVAKVYVATFAEVKAIPGMDDERAQHLCLTIGMCTGVGNPGKAINNIKKIIIILRSQPADSTYDNVDTFCRYFNHQYPAFDPLNPILAELEETPHDFNFPQLDKLIAGINQSRYRWISEARDPGSVHATLQLPRGEKVAGLLRQPTDERRWGYEIANARALLLESGRDTVRQLEAPEEEPKQNPYLALMEMYNGLDSLKDNERAMYLEHIAPLLQNPTRPPEKIIRILKKVNGWHPSGVGGRHFPNIIHGRDETNNRSNDFGYYNENEYQEKTNKMRHHFIRIAKILLEISLGDVLNETECIDILEWCTQDLTSSVQGNYWQKVRSAVEGRLVERRSHAMWDHFTEDQKRDYLTARSFEAIGLSVNLARLDGVESIVGQYSNLMGLVRIGVLTMADISTAMSGSFGYAHSALALNEKGKTLSWDQVAKAGPTLPNREIEDIYSLMQTSRLTSVAGIVDLAKVREHFLANPANLTKIVADIKIYLTELAKLEKDFPFRKLASALGVERHQRQAAVAAHVQPSAFIVDSKQAIPNLTGIMEVKEALGGIATLMLPAGSNEEQLISILNAEAAQALIASDWNNILQIIEAIKTLLKEIAIMRKISALKLSNLASITATQIPQDLRLTASPFLNTDQLGELPPGLREIADIYRLLIEIRDGVAEASADRTAYPGLIAADRLMGTTGALLTAQSLGALDLTPSTVMLQPSVEAGETKPQLGLIHTGVIPIGSLHDRKEESIAQLRAIIRECRKSSFGFMPLGAKLHLDQKINLEVLEELARLFGRTSGGFSIDAKTAIVLDALPSAEELELLMRIMGSFDTVQNSKPQLQMCMGGRLDKQRAAILGSAVSLATEVFIRYSKSDFLTNQDNITGGRMMVYDAGGALSSLPFVSASTLQSKHRTDMLCRHGVGDASRLQALHTILLQGMHQDGPFAHLADHFIEEWLAALNDNGLGHIIDDTWVFDRDHEPDTQEARQKHYDNFTACADAHAECGQHFAQTGQQEGIVFTARRLFAELRAAAQPIQAEMLSSDKYCNERTALLS